MIFKEPQSKDFFFCILFSYLSDKLNYREIKNAQKTKRYFLPQYIKCENVYPVRLLAGVRGRVNHLLSSWPVRGNKKPKSNCLLGWQHPSVVIRVKERLQKLQLLDFHTEVYLCSSRVCAFQLMRDASGPTRGSCLTGHFGLYHWHFLKGQNTQLLKLDDKVSETTNEKTGRKVKTDKYQRDKHL